MTKFKEAFIVEDLTPSRAKLINYVKKERNDEFVLGHTYNNACMYVCFFISQPQQHKTKHKNTIKAEINRSSKKRNTL